MWGVGVGRGGVVSVTLGQRFVCLHLGQSALIPQCVCVRGRDLGAARRSGTQVPEVSDVGLCCGVVEPVNNKPDSGGRKSSGQSASEL